MRIYLAAKFERRTEIRPIRDALWKMGHEVVSTWLDEVKRPRGMSSDIFQRKLAVKDVAEIQSADLLILDTFVVPERGGTGVEYGLALGQFQRTLVYIVGPARNVFHQLCDRRFENWNDCLAVLKEMSDAIRE